MDRIHPDYWNDVLIREIPELAPHYATMLESWSGESPGAHVVYGDLLVPFIVRLLSTPETDEPALKRTFRFLEELASEGDQYIRSVLGASVFEDLASRGLLEKAKLFMGSATRELSRS